MEVSWSQEKVQKNPLNKQFFSNWAPWKIKILNAIISLDNIYPHVIFKQKYVKNIGGVSLKTAHLFLHELVDHDILLIVPRGGRHIGDKFINYPCEYVLNPIYHRADVRAALSSIIESFKYFSIKLIDIEYYVTEGYKNLLQKFRSWRVRWVGNKTGDDDLKEKDGSSRSQVNPFGENPSINPTTGRSAPPLSGHTPKNMAKGRSPEAALQLEGSLSNDPERNKLFNLLVNNSKKQTKEEIWDEFYSGRVDGAYSIF